MRKQHPIDLVMKDMTGSYYVVIMLNNVQGKYPKI